MISKISKSIYIPLVAHGGAGNLDHIKDAINIWHQLLKKLSIKKKNMGVLINSDKV